MAAAQAPGRLRRCPRGWWGSQIEDARQYEDGPRLGAKIAAGRRHAEGMRRERVCPPLVQLAGLVLVFGLGKKGLSFF